MTIERFSQLSGLDEGVLQGHIRRGYLPTIKVDRYTRFTPSTYQRKSVKASKPAIT
tara:strand:- start:13776 stop:13943 length:168 start_codon:yes stop_codon:yes gene_type:complete